PAGQAAAQIEKGPAAAGEEAVITGRITRGQQADGAQGVGDGVAADGQGRGQQQDGKAEKSWAAEDRGEGFNERAGLGRRVGVVASAQAGLTPDMAHALPCRKGTSPALPPSGT